MKKVLLVLTLSVLTIFGFSQVPTITTNSVTNITNLRATCGGDVTNIGGDEVTKRGIIWSTSNTNLVYTPILNQINTDNSNTFSTFVAPLLPSTTYYVRAFAINSSGIGYGQIIQFQTLIAGENKKWYWSTSGNDNNDGTSPSTPKKTLAKLQDLMCCGDVTFLPGDTIFFKRGDVFANGFTAANGFPYVSCSFTNRPELDYTAPSGTPGKPIVLTNYGDATLPLPNFLFPSATPQVRGSSEQHYVMRFNGVSNIIVDGLQFNDTRFNVVDKATPAYTIGGILMGEYTNTSVNGTDTIWGTNRVNGDRRGSVFNFTLRNCLFNNISFGLPSVSAFNSKITKCTFTNLKSTADTFGINDVLAGAIEALYGDTLEISYNYFKGAWSKSGRNSSTQGMGGITMDVFNFKNSKVIYNKIIDCSNFIEAGSLDVNDSLSGMMYDTIAYNLIINSGNMMSLHTTCGDVFKANIHNLSIWNNIIIENNKSRFSGSGFGQDVYGDGQDFKWWFYGNNFLTTGYNDINATFNSLSFQFTLNKTEGVKIGSTFYGPEKETQKVFPPNAEQYGTVIAINGNVVTMDKKPAYSGTKPFLVFPPLADKGITWSQPNNPTSSGYYGTFDNNVRNARLFIEYAEPFCWGSGYDTLVDLRNNIFYNTTGFQTMYDDTRTRVKRANNVYYFSGGFAHTYTNGGVSYNNISRLGDEATLRPTERIVTTGIFKDTTAGLPENWDFHLATGGYSIGGGSPIVGVTKDFAGVPLTGTMDIGLYKYSATPILVLNSSTNVTCKTANNGSFTISASGGTAPYTYKVNNSLYTSATTYSNLAPATYTVTVKDAKGLLSTLNVTIKSSSVTCQ